MDNMGFGKWESWEDRNSVEKKKNSILSHDHVEDFKLDNLSDISVGSVEKHAISADLVSRKGRSFGEADPEGQRRRGENKLSSDVVKMLWKQAESLSSSPKKGGSKERLMEGVVIENMVKRGENEAVEQPLDGSSEMLLAAFQDMLREAEERAEAARVALERAEESFNRERRKWGETWRKLERRNAGLEKELGRAMEVVKESELSIGVEKERRRHYKHEADELTASWREANERQKKLLALSSLGEQHEAPDEKELPRYKDGFDGERSERLRIQRDRLEDERDELEEKLRKQMKDAREREKEMEIAFQAREAALIEEIKTLEAKLEDSEILWNRREALLLQERRAWELDMNTYKKSWDEERENLQAVIVDREHWMDEQIREWASILEAKEEEFSHLMSVQKKLIVPLSRGKCLIDEMRNKLATRRKKHCHLYHHVGDPVIEYSGGKKDEEESDVKEGFRIELSMAVQGTSSESNALSIEKWAFGIEAELCELNDKLLDELDMIENEGVEEAMQVRWELEQRVADAQTSVENMKKKLEDKEAEMERSLSSHLISSEELAVEMKEKEVGWEKDVESTRLAMKRLEEQVHSKDCEIDNLRKGIEKLTSGLVVQRREVKISGELEWEEAVQKLASFDKQIAEAMQVIESLQNDLSAKEKELQEARIKGEDRFESQGMEPEQVRQLIEHYREAEAEWRRTEHTLFNEKEKLVQLLEAERLDTSEAMCAFQGAIRELRWALKHRRDVENTMEYERILSVDIPSFSQESGDELVRVHASHLEDVDRYVLELKAKLEEAEKKARAAEVALAVSEVKKEAARRRRSPRLSQDLVRAGSEDSRAYQRFAGAEMGNIGLNSSGNGDWGEADEEFRSSTPPLPRMISSRQQRLERRLSDQGFASSSISQGGPVMRQEQRRSTEHGLFLDSGGGSSASNWMVLRNPTDAGLLGRDSSLQEERYPLASMPSPRNQRKWLVDASWIENVRKEVTNLRHQVDLERQRVSVLGQVEAENRWLEEVVARVLEQKRESDSKVMELEKKEKQGSRHAIGNNLEHDHIKKISFFVHRRQPKQRNSHWEESSLILVLDGSCCIQ